MTSPLDLEAAIFDMDGVLIDSEPLWQRAEIELFSEIGVPLTPELCATTMGLRIDEVVSHWRHLFPWGEEPSEQEMVGRVVQRMVELVSSEGHPIDGSREAIDACRSHGLRLALATSSYVSIMNAVMTSMELEDAFEVTYSGQEEPFGKPHPGIYLTVAERLGVQPVRCACVEDSINGVIAAKAARMTCVAVPDVAAGDERFIIADVLLGSLRDLPPWLEDVVPVHEQHRE